MISTIKPDYLFLSLQNGDLSIWVRPVSPPGSAAVAFLYTGQSGGPTKAVVTMATLGLNMTSGYDVTEVFDGKDLGHVKPNETFCCYVNPTGVYLIKATPSSDTKLYYKSGINRKFYRENRL